MNGGRLVSQGVDLQGSRAEFSLLANNSGEGLRVVRRRTLGAGMHDELLFTNDSGAAVEAVVSVECAADFEDIFAVRGFAQAVQRNEAFEEVLKDALRYTYRREGFSRGTEVRLSAEGVEPEMERGRISLRLRIGAREKRLVRISVKIEEGGEMVQDAAHAPLYTGAPELETSWDVLRKSWERSIEDLESLTFDAGDRLLVPAAGTPVVYGALREGLAHNSLRNHDPDPRAGPQRVAGRWQNIRRPGATTSPTRSPARYLTNSGAARWRSSRRFPKGLTTVPPTPHPCS